MTLQVLEIGVLKFKGETYPWRLLEDGNFQIFYEKLSEWKDIFSLSKK